MTHNAGGITETAVPVFPSSAFPITLIKLWTWGRVIKGCATTGALRNSAH